MAPGQDQGPKAVDRDWFLLPPHPRGAGLTWMPARAQLPHQPSYPGTEGPRDSEGRSSEDAGAQTSGRQAVQGGDRYPVAQKWEWRPLER